MSTPEAASPPTPPAVPLSRGRRITVRVLLTLATILTIVSIFAVWANRQVLNADNWSNTSTAMLESPEIRSQLSAYLIDQVYANVDVAGEIGRALPPRIKPLAGPAANSLRDLAQKQTDNALQRPRVQQLWKNANRVTAQQFINIAEGKSGAITSSGNAVVLDLRVVVLNLVSRLGLGQGLAQKIPSGAGKVKIMSSNQVGTLQDAVSVLKGLSVVLPALAVALLSLAVYLSRGRRRRVLMFAGLDLILAGIVVLIARNVAGNSVVDSLASTDAVRPAASEAWSIGTRMLKDIAQSTIIAAIPVIAAAWLAGPYRPAVAIRRAAAPTLRDRPDVAYAGLCLVLLLVIAWGPIPATRMLVPVIVMSVLAAIGLAALRRQTAEEFPEARSGAAPAAARERASRALKALQSTRRREPAAAPANGGAAPPPTTVVTEPPDRLSQLERLATLHDQGVLSDDEFTAEKTSVLTGQSRT